jgi:K+-sensing histidine kinase KdpD
VDTPKHNYPELFSFAVHELRTPLSVYGGYIGMVLRDADGLTDRQRKMLEEAAKSVKKSTDILLEISDFAKLDNGRSTLTTQRLDLFTLIAQVADLVHEGRDRGVRLEMQGAAQGAVMSGDPPWLRRAFEAIFRSILREKSGGVTVVADRRVQQIGGTPHAVVVIAEPGSVQVAYEREAGQFYDRRGGMGFALTLAGLVIRKHGGRVWSPVPDGEFVEPATDERALQDPVTRGSMIVSIPIRPITELPR